MKDGTLVYSYTYGLFGKQDSYTSDAVVYTYYTYRPDGLRHSIGNTIHIWDGANIVADVEGNDVTVYFRGINLIYAENDGDFTYYHFNAHGDVVVLTDANGTKEKTYYYSSFGAQYAHDALDDNPFRYCGEYYDKVSGTIYLRVRYYNTDLGRFTQEDPIRDGRNWYVYCGGNPVNKIDPTGTTAQDFWTGLATAVDDSVFGGLAMWIVETISGEPYNYCFDDEVDYYLGRVVGDILGAITSITEFIAGLKTIAAAITSGGLTTIMSGGTLTVAGVAICVEGVALGVAVVADGAIDLTASLSNLDSDWDNLVTAYEKKSKMYDTSSDVSDSRKYKKPVSGKTAKEKAKDVPSWAKGHAPYVNENGSEFAKRLMDEKYGPGNYSTGPNSAYSEIKKWGDRGFE